MNDNEQDLKQALQQFSVKFYEKAPFEEGTNFVASPLGIWLLLSQLAGANSHELSEEARSTLEDLLGLSVEAAYDYSNQLFRTAPDVIKTANAAWVEGSNLSAIEKTWVENLLEAGIATVENQIPTQAEIDSWTKEKTLNIIDKFPMDLTGGEIVILANVLATRITWDEFFEEVDNDIPHWNASSLLLAPSSLQQKIVEDITTGEKYAVVRNAGRNLQVYSVIAANPELSQAHVLEVAEHIMASSDRIATVTPDTLEDNHLWTVTDFESSRGDVYSTHLPAWEAESQIDVVGQLSFPVKEASEALSGAAHDNLVAMVQTAKAKFNKKGFEAAAVTAFTMMRSGLPAKENRKRVTIRFTHDYAVVAAYRNFRPADTGTKLWNDLPVFTAWVTQASEVSDDDF